MVSKKKESDKIRNSIRVPVIIRRLNRHDTGRYRDISKGDKIPIEYSWSRDLNKNMHKVEEYGLYYDPDHAPKSITQMKRKVGARLEKLSHEYPEIYHDLGYNNRNKPKLYSSYITWGQYNDADARYDPRHMSLSEMDEFMAAYLGDLAMKNRRRSLRGKHPITRSHGDIRAPRSGSRILK